MSKFKIGERFGFKHSNAKFEITNCIDNKDYAIKCVGVFGYYSKGWSSGREHLETDPGGYLGWKRLICQEAE